MPFGENYGNAERAIANAVGEVLSTGTNRILVNTSVTTSSIYQAVASNTYSFSAVPTGKTWHIYNVRIDYTASSTSGNRQLMIDWYDGSGNIMSEFRVGFTQAASLRYFYVGGIGLPDMTALRDSNFISFPIPAGWEIPAGHTLRVRDRANISASDSFNVSLIYKEFSIL